MILAGVIVKDTLFHVLKILLFQTFTKQVIENKKLSFKYYILYIH